MLLEPNNCPLTCVESCRVAHSRWIAAATSVDSASSSSGNCSVTLLKQLLSIHATVSSTSQYMSHLDPPPTCVPGCAIELDSLRGVAQCCAVTVLPVFDSSETRLYVCTPDRASVSQASSDVLCGIDHRSRELWIVGTGPRFRPHANNSVMSKAVCTVYRTFFRYARQLQAAGQVLDIRQPVDKEAWQAAKHSWIVNDAGMHKPTCSPILLFSCQEELTYNV